MGFPYGFAALRPVGDGCWDSPNCVMLSELRLFSCWVQGEALVVAGVARGGVETPPCRGRGARSPTGSRAPPWWGLAWRLEEPRRRSAPKRQCPDPGCPERPQRAMSPIQEALTRPSA